RKPGRGLLPQWPRCLERCRRPNMLNGLLNDLSFRMRSLFRPSAVESELDDELLFHFDQQVEKHVRAGLTREEATRKTRLEFGGISQVKEDCRESHGI